MSDLLNCPFCGGDAVIKDSEFMLIGCNGCQALEAIQTWQRRADRPTPDDKAAQIKDIRLPNA